MMKTFYSYCLLFILFFILNPACPQTRVIHIPSDKDTVSREGLIYALPKTFIRIDVRVEKEENIKGPYAIYANKFLGLKNVIYSNHTIYEIKDIQISTFTEPDPDQYYLIAWQNNGKSRKARKLNEIRLCLTESGLIHSVNANEEMVFHKAIPEEKRNGGGEYPAIFKYYADNNLFEQTDTIFEISEEDSLIVMKQVLKKTYAEKSLEQRAQEAAEYILKLKENRFNLISGYQEVPYSEGTVQYMNEQLEKLENEYLKLFTGLTFKKEIIFSFSYVPEINGDIKSDVLFKFSDRFGVFGPDRELGENVMLTVERSGYTKDLSPYVKKRIYNNKKQGGIVYRIPEYANVSVNYGGKILQSKRIQINQFGVTARIPSTHSKVIFYPESGAIKSVVTGE